MSDLPKVNNVKQYGSLNENGPHRLMGSGTNRRSGLGGLALMEEVYLWGWTWRFQMLKIGLVSHSLLLMSVDVI